MAAKKVAKKSARKQAPLDPAVITFFTKLAKARGLTNITVTEHEDALGEPVIIDHAAGLFYGVSLKKLCIFPEKP